MTREFDSYESWDRAQKIIGIDKLGDFDTAEWERNKESAAGYLDMLDARARVGKRVRLREALDWDPARSGDYWRSIITIYEFYSVRRALGAAGGDDILAGIDPAVRAKLKPSTPEWLAIHEPKLRAWVAYAKRCLSDADRRHREALKDDSKAEYVPPEIEAFNPDTIEEEVVRNAPPLGFRSSGRKGAWDLNTVDWPGLTGEAGIYISSRGDGWHDITCPWSDTHSDGKPEAGVCEPSAGKPGGYHCFHSHGGATADLMEWLVSKLGMEAVERHCERYSEGDLAGLVIGRPKFPKMVTNKKGEEYTDPNAIENTKAMLAHHRISVRYNLMTHDPEVIAPDGVFQVAEAATNAGLSHIRDLARRYTLNVGAVDDHIRVLVAQDSYHPVADWIEATAWDGRDRIDDLLDSLTLDPDFDRDLAMRLLTTWLVTAAAAALVPARVNVGVAAQGVLVLQGEQNLQKTRWLMALCPPDSGWFKEGMLLDPASRDSVQQATRFWVTELGELDATFRRADVARLKAFATETADVYRSAYDRREEQHPRRTVFCGSVNPSTFLMDSTGNRRYWTTPVLKCDPEHGIDLQQLWSQAAHLHSEGHPTWLDPDTMDALNTSNRNFEATDPVEEALEQFFALDADHETAQPEIVGTLKDAVGRWGRRESLALTAALNKWSASIGRKRRKSGGKRLWPVRRRTADSHLSLVDEKPEEKQDELIKLLD